MAVFYLHKLFRGAIEQLKFSKSFFRLSDHQIVQTATNYCDEMYTEKEKLSFVFWQTTKGTFVL